MSLLGVLESILKSFYKYNKNFVLRGSLLFKKRVNSERSVKDIDFFIIPEYFREKKFFQKENLISVAKSILDNVEDYKITIKSIFTDFFEDQHHITFSLIARRKSDLLGKNTIETNLDIGLDANNLKYIDFDYELQNKEFLKIKVSPKYVSAAWKIGLILKGNWRVKDVIDLYYIMKSLENDTSSDKFKFEFGSSIKEILSFSKIDKSRINLFLQKKFGKSRGARKKWKNYNQNQNVNNDLEMSETFNYISDSLSKIHEKDLISQL
jgi:hypothetical protein